MSAGFASVFDTPLAGAVFGLEVLTIGTVPYDALFPCFLAAFAGDYVTRAWHIHDTLYTVGQVVPLTPVTMLLAAATGIVFGLTAQLFAWTTHAISSFFKQRIAYPLLRPFIGGILIAMAVLIPGVAHMGKYIGLGLSTIAAAFNRPLPPYDFAGKLVFTAATLRLRLQRRRGHSALLHRRDTRQCPFAYRPAALVTAGRHGLRGRLCRCRQHADHLQPHGARDLRP